MRCRVFSSRLWRRIGVVIAIGILTVSCSNDEGAGEEKVLRIGTSVGDFATMAHDFLKPELAKAGYRLEVSEFTDILAPNIALNDGSLDFNTYQHAAFLSSFNELQGANLTAIFQIPTGPLGLYSGRRLTLAEVGEGARIAIPNDVSNYSRALILLQDLGWITLSESDDAINFRESNIIDNPYNIILMEIASPQIARIREDVDYAIITGNFAASSGIPFTEALFTDPGFDYINWMVVRDEDREEPWVALVEMIYNSEEFKAYIAAEFPGYKHPKEWDESIK